MKSSPMEAVTGLKDGSTSAEHLSEKRGSRSSGSSSSVSPLSGVGE